MKNVLSRNQSRPSFEVEAIVIRACSNCGAPGVDKNNKYVGETCPNCGSKRPNNEDKGTIYSSDPWFHFKRKIKNWFGR